MALGEFGQNGPTVFICCGPRCASEPGHRTVYDAVEKRVLSAFADLSVRPTLCQGLCGGGVTVTIKPAPHAPVVKQKIRDIREARAFVPPMGETINKDI